MTLTTVFVAFFVGLVFGILISAKNPVEYVRELDEKRPGTFGWMLLGLLIILFGAMLNWFGVVLVLLPFGLYHLMGREAWSLTIRKFVDNLRMPRFGKKKEVIQGGSPVEGDGPELERQLDPMEETPMETLERVHGSSDDEDVDPNTGK